MVIIMLNGSIDKANDEIENKTKNPIRIFLCSHIWFVFEYQENIVILLVSETRNDENNKNGDFWLWYEFLLQLKSAANLKFIL